MPQDISSYIKALHKAVHAASADCYRWSNGSILYDHGVEAMLQVYAARELFAQFGDDGQAIVRIESRCRDAGLNEAGRIDLTFARPGVSLAIECKRYTTSGNISGDLARLRRFNAVEGRFGLLVAPCYIKASEGPKHDDWPLHHANQRAAQVPTETWHLSEKRALPEKGHAQGWSHERALVIEV